MAKYILSITSRLHSKSLWVLLAVLLALWAGDASAQVTSIRGGTSGTTAEVKASALAGTEAGLVIRCASGCSGSGGTASSYGAAFPATGTAVGFSDGTNMVGARTFDADSGAGTENVLGVHIRAAASGGSVGVPGDATNGLWVNCKSGCSGSSFADNSAFTFGTSTVSPIAGVLDDVATNAATENAAAVMRITAQKGLHVNLRDVSGTELATAGAPLRIDPTGSTAQPVTGTFWQATQPISAASLPLPTGASTAAKQPALGTAGTASTDVITIQGIASMTAVKVDGSAVTQPVSGTFWQATQPVSLATNIPVGSIAHDAAGAGVNPLLTGCYASAAAPTDVTADNDAVRAWCLRNGARSIQPTFAGILASTGTGASGTGTQRVVLSSDSALAANQSVNVAQINGVATTMGNGVSGTGVQRVTIASDSTGQVAIASLPNEGQQTAANSISVTPDTDNDSIGATGAAPPGEATFVGGLTSGATGGFLTGFAVCDSFVNVNVSTATTTALVTGVSGRHVRICSLNLVTAAANNVALISGTGATCGTGTTGMNGGTTAASGWNFAANGGLTQGTGLGAINQTNATGDSVCIVTSAATQLSGRIAYAIY